MTSLLLAATMFLAAANHVEVHSVDGAHVEGQLIAIDTEHVVVQAANGKRSLPLTQLQNIQPAHNKDIQSVPSPLLIGLVDGSTIAAEQFTVESGQATIVSSDRTTTCPCSAVRSVRLTGGNDAVITEWNRLSGLPFDSDVLVVGRGVSLNYHRGVLRDVSAEKAAFELDGDVLQIKRAKIFGWIYYHPSGRSLPGSVATLIDTSGSRWTVHTISFSDGAIHVTTPAGLSVVCPIDRLFQVDFSDGKSLYLGQMNPRSVHWTPYLGLADEPASRKAFFAPLHDPTDKSCLLVGGRRYTRGIALCSRTELRYDLPDGFRRLKAIAAIDDEYRPRGNAQLVIRADDRVVFDAAITGEQPPQTLDLDIAGAKRLTILVDFGQEMDLGDHVDLGDARLVK